MDFEHPPLPPDEYSSDFRQTIGLAPDDILILQPTRVVPRKGIEHSIELVRQLNDGSCKLVVSHTAGDEGEAYAEWIRNYAQMMGVPVVFADPWIHHRRGVGPEGQKQYTIWDAYKHADNYRVACRFFSYNRVQNELQAILDKPGLAPPCGCEPT